MTCKVAALYQFVALPDFRDLRPPLRALCERLGLKGTLLLAPEGLNGTLAGTASAIDALVTARLQAAGASNLDFESRLEPAAAGSLMFTSTVRLNLGK